jgi:hypothetical protein
VNVPDEVRDGMKRKLWTVADQLDWLAMGPVQKSQRYKHWANEPDVGGVLSRFMDVRQVRVYIKDTLMKKYPQARRADTNKPFQLLGILSVVQTAHSFIRPHGRHLCDGRVICWRRAADWKSIIMAVHERAFQIKGARPFAAILFHSAAKYASDESRAVVNDAALKLGIERVIWDE